MNKYEKDLKYIGNKTYKHHYEKGVYTKTKDIPEYKSLTELVERATPKKVTRTYFSVGRRNTCPNCDTGVNALTEQEFCDNCGQALDWSE